MQRKRIVMQIGAEHAAMLKDLARERGCTVDDLVNEIVRRRYAGRVTTKA